MDLLQILPKTGRNMWNNNHHSDGCETCEDGKNSNHLRRHNRCSVDYCNNHRLNNFLVAHCRSTDTSLASCSYTPHCCCWYYSIEWHCWYWWYRLHIFHLPLCRRVDNKYHRNRLPNNYLSRKSQVLKEHL